MTTPRQQQGSQECTPLVGDALRRMEEVIRAAIPAGEVVVHFDVLVETRCGPDARRIKFRRFSPPGSDPLLSLGLLTAIKARLIRRLGFSDD